MYQQAEKIIYNKFASLLYNALTHTVKLTKVPYVQGFWKIAWDKSCFHFKGPVKTRIHGRQVVVNFGNTYPLNSRIFATYNNPLIELVNQCYSLKNSPITLIDVGAATGDTILLIDSNCPNMINDFYCVDGDPEFFSYLNNNLSHLKEGKLILSLLSSSEGFEKNLIRTHGGTASAQGDKQVPSSTLDSIIERYHPRQIDVLKTDVDGFDGKVLKGARNILQKYKPSVIFEWHPILCKQTGNSWLDHFEVLEENGYKTFIWFSKYGGFNHFMANGENKSIEVMAELCFSNKAYDDLHYDIVALHHDSKISPIMLAELAFARNRKSLY